MKRFNLFKSSSTIFLLLSLLYAPLGATVLSNSDISFDDESSVEASDASRKQKKKCKNPCNARFNNISACNALIKKNLTVKGTTNLNGQVNNNIGNVYTIYSPTDPNYSKTDFLTIQDGIDFASSGLKPDAAAGDPASNGSNVTLNLQPGYYPEGLYIDNGLGEPDINDPAAGLTGISSRGLRIIGDTRPIAAMTYFDGGYCESDINFFDGGYPSGSVPQGYLGTLDALVSLSLDPTGTIITVTLSSDTLPVIQPDFGMCGVVPGVDQVIVYDNIGSPQEATVTGVNGNRIIVGTPVTIDSLDNGKGNALTFCPNVQVGTPPSSDVGAQCYLAGGTAEIVGVWFRPQSPSTVYNIPVFNNSLLYASQLLVETINEAGNPTGYEGFVTDTGGAVVTDISNGSVSAHITVIGYLGASNMKEFGNWYVLTPFKTFHRDAVGILSAGNRQFACNSIQISANAPDAAPPHALDGIGLAGIGNNLNVDILIFSVLSIFNCTNGLNLGPNMRVDSQALMQIDSCTTGINAIDAHFAYYNYPGTRFTGTPLATITNCSTSLALDLNSSFVANDDVTISVTNPALTDTVGVQATNGSEFICSTNVFFDGVAVPYAIDESSRYITPNNAGTNPSPSDIFTNTASGTLNSAYLKQAINSATSISLSFNPSTLIPSTIVPPVAGTPIYIGKTFQLTVESGAAHTLTLTGGATFLGGAGTGTIATFDTAGSTITFTILSGTQVAINASSGVAIS